MEIINGIKTYETPFLGIFAYECKHCHNTWSLEEGFRLDTGQCKGCQEYDDTKEEREARYDRWSKMVPVDFPYMAGDPFW